MDWTRPPSTATSESVSHAQQIVEPGSRRLDQVASALAFSVPTLRNFPGGSNEQKERSSTCRWQFSMVIDRMVIDRMVIYRMVIYRNDNRNELRVFVR
jgi:hypothetical protein